MERILLVTESTQTQSDILSLLGHRYNVEIATTAQEARQKTENIMYHLILIQTFLSDQDGFRLCESLRNFEKTQGTPIILIDGDQQAKPQARAAAFSVGANDLIRLPINALEFVAEVSAKIQFRKSLARAAGTSVRGPFQIELETQKAYLKKNDELIDLDLTPIEFKMFVLFTNNANQPLSRDRIRATIWGK